MIAVIVAIQSEFDAIQQMFDAQDRLNQDFVSRIEALEKK